MIAPIISNKLPLIKEVCKKYGVKSLYLFGSATSSKVFTKNSDIDFLVEYEKDEIGLPKEPFDYFDLWFALEKIVGKKVDLLVVDAVRNSIFKQTVEKQKILIYE